MAASKGLVDCKAARKVASYLSSAKGKPTDGRFAAPIRAPLMGAAWRFVRHLHGQLNMHAVLHGVPGRLYRGVWLEPRRKFHCLFGVATDRRGNIATRGCTGGSTWT